MAKRTGTGNIAGLLAFLALIIKTVDYILKYFGGDLGILTFVADIILIAVALLVAWSYARTCKQWVRIVYIIILILVVLGLFFGYRRIL